MIDGVVYLLENYLEIIENEYITLNLCNFFLYEIINKY